MVICQSEIKLNELNDDEKLVFIRRVSSVNLMRHHCGIAENMGWYNATRDPDGLIFNIVFYSNVCNILCLCVRSFMRIDRKAR